MFPSVVNTLLQSLPNVGEVSQMLPKLQQVKALLASMLAATTPLSSEQQDMVLRRLDRALVYWRQKKKATSQYNSLCGLYEVARSLKVTARTLEAELEGRGVTNALTLIQEIKAGLLGTASLLAIPGRQTELMYQVLESVVLRMTANRLTPPLQRSISDEVLAAMSDEALESLPAEDNIISGARRLMGSILRFANSFQMPNVEIEYAWLDQLTNQLRTVIDNFKQLEDLAYDICEMIHDLQQVDPQRLQPANLQYFNYLFPSEIIVHEPAQQLGDSWREAALSRQLKTDMEYMLSDCVRSHPVANALMAQFAQTKDLKLYEEAKHLVLPEARKKLEVRLATAILNKATDEQEQKGAIHRYPVEISTELKAHIAGGDLVGAMQVIEPIAIQLMQRYLPDFYSSGFDSE